MQKLTDRLNNLKNRTDRDYEFAWDSQRSYDKWQIDILEEIQALWDGWISVSERFPTYTGTFPEEYVMVYNWKKVFEALFTEDTNWNWTFWTTDENSDWFYKDITHWMPLPLPPKK